MALIEILKKQGGINLLKQYYKGGALLTAIVELLLLGKEKKALEILRLSTQYKIKRNLEKKYYKYIEQTYANTRVDSIHEISNKVWVCWFQGINNAPELVKKCYQSLKENLTDRDIILITEDNMFDYVSFPKYICEKWKRGQITHTHMTDLLRLELLIKYGGMWIDATVLCTCRRENIPDYFFESELFLYQTLKPGCDGQSQPVSSWLISAKSNNKILRITRDLCYKYWETNNDLVDYFLFHDFLVIALEHNIDEWNRIIPRDNAAPHLLLLRLFDEYNEQMWMAIKEQTPFHKLTYKFCENQRMKENSFYAKLIK